MKRFFKSMQGVTLLEIMLVLAIAAMIIVMSVRYYQSAQASSQANAFVSQVQAIASAAENLAQGTGAYPSLTTIEKVVNVSTVTVPPWGGSMTYAPAATGFSLTGITAPGPATCALLTAKFAQSSQFVFTPCTSITYTSAQ